MVVVMSGFDFRDMLGGASVKLGKTPEIAIGEIGRDMFQPILEQAKLHSCNPADVIASALTHIAVCYGKGGKMDAARDMLRHVARIAAAIEEALDEVDRG